MSNRETRRAQRPTIRRRVSKSEIKRANLMVALAFLIPVLLGAGLVWRARAAGMTTTQAAASTPDDTQSDPSPSDDIPTINPPAAPVSANNVKSPSNPKNETYLELDMSQGKGLFTVWRIEPSDELAVTEKGHFKSVEQLRRGDLIRMSQGLIGLVIKVEKYIDPHPNADYKPDADGNVAERVVGRSMHVTNTLLYLHTTSEVVGTTPEHPFFVHGKGWVKAGALQPGDQIETETANKLVTVVNTEMQHKREAVYNLAVENTHTFFVGKDKLLVHNGDCVPELEEAFINKGKAPWQVEPGTRTLEGQYINKLPNGPRIEPWRAHYDEFGRQIGRTDFNAGNQAEGIADTHYHTYGYNNGIRYPIINHAPGEYVP